MIAGKMKAKIELLEPKRTTDRMGAEQVSYEPTRTVHAERVAMSGKRSEEVGEHFPDYGVQFNISTRYLKTGEYASRAATFIRFALSCLILTEGIRP